MDRTPQPSKSAWWFAYFCFMLVLSVVGFVLSAASPLSLVFAIFNGFGFVGMWGYMSDKAIGIRQFWVVYAGLMLVGAAVIYGGLLWIGIRLGGTPLAIVVVAVIVSFPEWLAVWHYAFKSPHVWQLQQAAA